MKTILQILACTGALAALGCGGAGAEGEVDRHQLWLETAPQQYVARSCSVGFTLPGCTVSAVDAGQPVATQQQFGEDPWQEVEPASDVVMGMLDAAAREPSDRCKRRITEHDTYAFPARVYSDCGEEGWGIVISCFVAGTLDLARCQ